MEQQRSKAAPRLDAARQKAAAAAAAGNAHSKSKLVKVLPNKAERKGLSTLGVVGLAGALVGMRLCLRYKQQIREALRRLAKGGGGAHEGGVQGSSFRFPGAGRKAGAGVKADKGKSKSKAGAGTPVAGAARDATSSSLPRNKVSNNKKNKERKKGAYRVPRRVAARRTQGVVAGAGEWGRGQFRYPCTWMGGSVLGNRAVAAVRRGLLRVWSVRRAMRCAVRSLCESVSGLRKKWELAV